MERSLVSKSIPEIDGNSFIVKRRNELRIMTDLLSNTFQPTRLTHILYRTNLSYGQTKKYLSALHDMGLVEEISVPYRSYLITEKGRAFVGIVAGELKEEKEVPLK